jgi:hypothetical protein
MIPYTVPLTQILGKTILEALNIQKYHVYMLLVLLFTTILFSLWLTPDYLQYGMAFSLSIGIVIGEVFIMNYVYGKKARLDIRKYWMEMFKMVVIMSIPFIIYRYFLLFHSCSYFELFINILGYLSLYLMFLPILLNKYEKNLLYSFAHRIIHRN